LFDNTNPDIMMCSVCYEMNEIFGYINNVYTVSFGNNTFVAGGENGKMAHRQT